MDSCAECGFRYDSVAAGDLPDRLRSFGPRFADRLGTAGGAVHVRPAPEVWSALEYACHVRDALLVLRERLHLALAVDSPTFVSMHRDTRVTTAAYASTPVDDAAHELTVAAAMLARDAATLDDTALARRCTYHYPEPTERSVLWLLRHTVHEGEHHLGDVDAALASAGL